MSRKSLFAVLEDDSVSAPVAVVPEEGVSEATPAELVGDGAESVESELLEVSAAEGEIETIGSAMDDADRAVVAIENMILALEDAAESGGIDEAAAAVMKVGMDAILDNIGADPAEMAEATETPAVESYGSLSGKLRSTTAAIESFKETRDKVQASMLDAWNRFVAWIKQMWANFFDGVTKLKNRAVKLQGLLPKVKVAGSKEIESAKLFKAIAVDGKDSGEQTAVLVKLMESAIKSQNSATVCARSVAAAIEAAANGKAAFTEGMNNEIFAMTVAKKGETKDGITTYTVDGLPGGAVITQVTSADSKVTPENIGKFATTVEQKAAEGTKVNALDAGGLKSAVDGVLNIVKTLEAARSVEKEIAGLVKQMQSAFTKLKGAKVEGEEAKKGLTEAKKLASGSRNLLASPSVAVAGYVLRAASSQLYLVEQSIKAHGGSVEGTMTGAKPGTPEAKLLK